MKKSEIRKEGKENEQELLRLLYKIPVCLFVCVNCSIPQSDAETFVKQSKFRRHTAAHTPPTYPKRLTYTKNIAYHNSSRNKTRNCFGIEGKHTGKDMVYRLTQSSSFSFFFFHYKHHTYNIVIHSRIKYFILFSYHYININIIFFYLKIYYMAGSGKVLLCCICMQPSYTGCENDLI